MLSIFRPTRTTRPSQVFLVQTRGIDVSRVRCALLLHAQRQMVLSWGVAMLSIDYDRARSSRVCPVFLTSGVSVWGATLVDGYPFCAS